MLESQAAIAVGFNANTHQPDEHKNGVTAPSHIFAWLDDAQKDMMRWFMQGLSKAEMAQNAGIDVALMMQNFGEMRKKLGVTDDCNLLCLVHGPADTSKLNAATKKYGLTQEEKKVLMLRLGGASVLDISADLRKEAGDIMQEIFKKTGTRTLQSLFDAVHNSHNGVPHPSQPKINGNGHNHAAAPSVVEIRVRPAAPLAPLAEAKPQVYVHADSEGIPQEIAEILTPRELQIAKYKLRGLGYKEIAGALNLVASTVNGYVKEIYRKLDVHDENAFFNAIYGDIYPKELAALAKRYGMTRAEQDVLGRVLSGLSVKKTADEMHLSPYTINDHLKSVHQKMNVHGRDQIFFAAHEFLGRERVVLKQVALLEDAILDAELDKCFEPAVDNNTPSAP